MTAVDVNGTPLADGDQVLVLFGTIQRLNTENNRAYLSMPDGHVLYVDTLQLEKLTGSIATQIVASAGVGPTGPQGPQGIPGFDGEDGQDGAPGSVGATGPTGATGATGAAGAAGAVGPQGVAGLEGDDGQDGPAGPQGPTGAEGKAGAAGSNGTNGATGATGPSGPQGPPGDDGDPGPSGLTVVGPVGPQGPQGVAGPQGDDGEQGPPGPPSQPGNGYFEEVVSINTGATVTTYAFAMDGYDTTFAGYGVAVKCKLVAVCSVIASAASGTWTLSVAKNGGAAVDTFVFNLSASAFVAIVTVGPSVSGATFVPGDWIALSAAGGSTAGIFGHITLGFERLP